MKYTKITLNIIVLVMLFSSGCGDLKGPRYDTPEGNPGISPGTSIFPHIGGWVGPDIHGKYVINNGTNNCANVCHGEKFEGGTARGCKTCHELFPHQAASEWQGLSGHGKYVRSEGSTSKCSTTCHGADLAGGYDPKGKKSCTKCHTSYPHRHSEADWDSADHGRFVREVGSYAECSTMCHRQDVPEELKPKGCDSCHISYPLPHEDAGWKAGGHSEIISSSGGIASSDCTICHGKKLDGGSSKVACATAECHHVGSSSKENWTGADEHGGTASNDISKCLTCHGMDMKGNAVIEGCDKCHHKNWAETHEKPWSDKSEHGEYAKDLSTCKLCHGTEFSGGISQVACSICHGDLYPHGEGWSDKTKHGLVAKDDLSKCHSCHGEITSDDCKSCHHDNKSDWVNPDAPTHVDMAGQDTSGCKTCHGNNYYGGESTISCYDCHDPGSEYPHPADWLDKFNHGLQYQFERSDCKTACHGGGLEGGLTQVACNQCHTEYPHPNFSTWIDDHGGSVITAADDFNLSAFSNNCSNCHGPTYIHKKDDYPDNMSTEELVELYFVTNPATDLPVSLRCYACHFAYPHLQAISPSNGTQITWLKAHTKSIMVGWGDLDETCSKGDGCHFSSRKSANPVQKDGNDITLISDDCTEFCHKP